MYPTYAFKSVFKDYLFGFGRGLFLVWWGPLAHSKVSKSTKTGDVECAIHPTLGNDMSQSIDDDTTDTDTGSNELRQWSETGLLEADASPGCDDGSGDTWTLMDGERIQCNRGLENSGKQGNGFACAAADEEEDLFEAFDIVDAIVPPFDNPRTPALTFRVIVLGSIMCILSSIINTVFWFRTTTFHLSPILILMIAYPLGKWMAATLPIRVFSIPLASRLGIYPRTFSLNPGPFSHKEHVLIFIFGAASSTPTYALSNIAVQAFTLKMPMNPAWCLVFLLVMQFYGYGLSGLFRKILVRPAAMIYPSNLGIMAIIRSFHENSNAMMGEDEFSTKRENSDYNVDPESRDARKPMSGLKMLFISASVMFIWQWFPYYIAPMFSMVSILCLAIPSSTSTTLSKLRFLGSAQGGVGLLSLSFDWTVMEGPITIPLWVLVNDVLGLMFTFWVLIPLLWHYDFFGADSKLGANPAIGPNGTGQFPLGYAMNAFTIFDKNYLPVSLSSLLNHTTGITLNETSYAHRQPLYIPTDLAVAYGSKFLTLAAVITHVALWYGADIVQRARTAVRDLDVDDVHAQMMDVYPDVPQAWYITILVLNTVLALAMCTWGGFTLPWWMVTIALAMSVACLLPLGIIYAISGSVMSTQVIFELVGGYLLPGNLVEVMTFKTLGYMTGVQALMLTSDLKLAHYAKVPPRDMFWSQLLSSSIASAVTFLTCYGVYFVMGDKMLNGTDGWRASDYNIFMMSGLLWGAIGPARFFGPDSPYQCLLYCFLIGLILPVIPYMLHRFGFGSWWALVNIPLITTVEKFGNIRSFISILAVGFLVNYVIRKWRPNWWRRYAYLMSGGFDAGALLTGTVIFLCFFLRSQPITLPFYALNRIDPEQCSPDYFMTCLEHQVQAGTAYNPATDIPVCQSFGMAAMGHGGH
ncbi:OPT oligopeptide transporter protein-domain-containing protein [Chytriomyces sp. MP71]|nr:OPT oligopeptide transporter protein-domain-containing protein [Chytriomyces sp. MP71]